MLELESASSQNALKHGLCSQKIVLRDEDPAQFAALVDSWFNHYEPGDDEIAGALVSELARAHWLLRRAANRLDEVEYELPGNAHCWTDDMEKRFTNFNRYKRGAERMFLRFYKEVELYYDKHLRKDDKETALSLASSIEAAALRK